MTENQKRLLKMLKEENDKLLENLKKLNLDDDFGNLTSEQMSEKTYLEQIKKEKENAKDKI